MKTEHFHLGYKIEIVQDEHAESPDSWGNDDAFLVYDHRQFTVERKGFDPSEIFEQLQQTKRAFFDGYYVFPLYAYIHSGVALSLGRSGWPFNCPWDTSFKGFVLVKRAPGTWTRAKAQTNAEGIVDTWNMYLSGDVYGYIVSDKDGNELDSCWSFYGEKYCLEEAQAIAAYEFAKAFKARCETVKTFIRNRVPLNVRENQLAN